jgi:lysophospholipase L1-like esterase
MICSSRRSPGRFAIVATGLGLVGALVFGATAAVAVRTVHHSAATASKQYYVSVGDSYSTGYEPGPSSTRHGYADQIVPKAARRGYRLQLVNFGCGGATTTSILQVPTCALPAVNGPSYGGLTQAAAAESFLRAHTGQIALVTVSIGGNDVTMCAHDPNPITCVTQATAAIRANVSQLATDLRAAAGPKVPIVGLTYPDVVLGEWVLGPGNKNLAQLSVTAFKALINPALQQSYAVAGARFVDVTTATGAYIPLTRTTKLKPYGVIPVAVARVCTLTYYCEAGDIHANTTGYGVIADLIVATLPRV